MSLSFQQLRDASYSRNKRWHPGFISEQDEWTNGDWANAMAGEVGEAVEAVLYLVVASGKTSNNIKKLRRHEEGLNSNRDPSTDDLFDNIAKELADVIIYADLLASKLGLDLEDAIKLKFNEVSEQMGFSERL